MTTKNKAQIHRLKFGDFDILNEMEKFSSLSDESNRVLFNKIEILNQIILTGNKAKDLLLLSDQYNGKIRVEDEVQRDYSKGINYIILILEVLGV